MPEIKTLQQLLIEELGKRSIEKTELPDLITNNLNPSFAIREYQQKAFQFFLNYWCEPFEGKPRQNHQLLFHMATGSGKTLMMAGLILYLYDRGYRNFLFFVNSTNIINKTRENFLNPLSLKYLFADTISFGDRRVVISEVYNFQALNEDDINIVFSTIQGLHTSLNTPRENSLTYDDFEDKKLVLISDEAHHINVDTKKGKTRSHQEELFEDSWEGTVERIFRANPENVLLEFTATVDFSDPNLAAKYEPKLIFDYSLKQFRKDGFSKEVKVLQADMDSLDRALQAVLLSQYRLKIFAKYRKHIKPVILFKSKTIKASQQFFKDFGKLIHDLEVSQLEAIRADATDTMMKKVFGYFEANRISLENLITELKEDFAETKLIEVNSQEESEEKQLAVNSLEDNEFRAVFAVDKLNEGWDVLNLFDIVRLYDTRDSKANKVGPTTTKEAQLIGRGARYCPFQITEDQPLYGRKYDADLSHELRICEELYYHSAYNPKYIQELNMALEEIGIKAKTARERNLKLKENFKQTTLYKAGLLFLNERRPYSRMEVEGLDPKLINKTWKVQLRTGFNVASNAFEKNDEVAGTNRSARDYALASFGVPIVRKAMQRLEFYEFSILKAYLPHLQSVHEFIISPSYLGNIRVEVSGLLEKIKNLTADEKLDVAIQVLEPLSQAIAADKVDYKGTREFKPVSIKETFFDKTLNFTLDENSDREIGRSMNNIIETSHYLDLTTRNWYVFNDCFGSSEEKLLVKFIDKRYEDLKRKYSDVWLIRNEKHFKLYAFDDGRVLEPDYVLYLIGKEAQDTMHYQVFIEPKGSHLLKSDAWKEDFLNSIKANFQIEQLIENRTYAVWGLPFYNEEQRAVEFKEGFERLLEA